MKALVTGATGFVGSHVARVLLDAGHEVTVFRRAGSPLANLEGLPVRHAIGDLHDAASIREAVRAKDAVFHVAALYALWARDRHEFFEVNVEGTRRVLRAAAEAGARRIVYTSTVGAVRGCALGEVADETAVFNLDATRDPYVQSKRRAEEVAFELCAVGAPVVVVNPAGPIGPGDLRPTPTGEILVKFVNGKLPGYTGGGANFVDVRDVARGHLAAWERGRIGERYILGGRNLTVAELMQLLARETGLPAPRLRFPFFAVSLLATVLEVVAALTGRPPLLTRANVRILRHHLHVSSAKAERELGFSPRPLEESVRDAIADFDRRSLLRACRMNRVRRHWAAAASSR
jgi:dihydroflavonol-4-reductase